MPAADAASPPVDANDRALHGVAARLWLLVAPLFAGFVLTGCSLLTIKSPEIPLTAREQEARLLTRDYAAHFATTFTHLTDEATQGGDPGIRSQALRLKLSAVTEITRASTGLAPIPSLLDSWAFSLQLRDFLVGGAGASLLGTAQSAVAQGATGLAGEADDVARRIAGDDYSRYQAFVLNYVEHNPLETAEMLRPSVLSAWLSEDPGKTSVHAVGTVAQALGDVSDRVRIYGERVPTLGLWQAELALDHAGFDEAAYRTALHRLDDQLERISKLADSSPQLAHEAIAELRGSLRASTDQLDTAWMQTLRTLRAEREALTVDIAAEREGIAAAVDTQRARITADAAQITANAVDTSWRELRRLIREALLLTVLVIVVLLGLPFAAGYLVGRRRERTQAHL